MGPRPTRDRCVSLRRAWSYLRRGCGVNSSLLLPLGFFWFFWHFLLLDTFIFSFFVWPEQKEGFLFQGRQILPQFSILRRSPRGNRGLNWYSPVYKAAKLFSNKQVYGGRGKIILFLAPKMTYLNPIVCVYCNHLCGFQS